MTLDHAQINDLRQRIVRGEEVSEEEVTAAIDYLISLRESAANSASPQKPKTSAKAKQSAKAKAAESLGDLLGGL
jgi:predicted DNA-binding protein (UPF0278 family)